MADEKQQGRQSAAAAKAAEKEAAKAADKAAEAEAPAADEPTEAPAEQPARPSVARYAREEHIELARGMYRQPNHVVAAALALISEREDGNVREGYSKQEVEAAIADLGSVEVKES